MALQVLEILGEGLLLRQREDQLAVLLEHAHDLPSQPPQETIQRGAGSSLQVEEDRDVAVGEPVGELLQDRGLADPPLPVDDQDVIGKLPRQTVLNPVKDVLPAEEHLGVGDRRAGDVGVQWVSYCGHSERLGTKGLETAPMLAATVFVTGVTARLTQARCPATVSFLPSGSAHLQGA